MKKFSIAVILCIFCAVLFFSLNKSDTHTVLKIISPVEFYVDFNDNMVADTEELVHLQDIDIEPDELDKTDILRLKYLGLKYARENLLNKNIKVFSDSNGNTQVLLNNGIDYRKSLIDDGLVYTRNNKDKVKQKIEYAKTINLVAYNKNTKRYHRLDCKYAFDSPFIEVKKLSELEKDAMPCKYCHVTYKKPESSSEKHIKYPRDVYEKYMPLYKDSALEFYVTDFVKYFYPSSKCLTTACQSLLKEINNAAYSIDFAIYGIDNQPEITNALINAQKRGVQIRWVYDTNKKGSTIYSETLKLKNSLQNCRRDIDYPLQYASEKPVKDAIMHNKFFIFDNKKVWTGSANISHTDLSGFNANSAVLINSENIAKIYKREFEQMYSGKFHMLKSLTEPNINQVDASKMSVYFSPQDSAISKHILVLINNSKKYVYVPVFVVTHKSFVNALINAKNRGVDVRLIVDATSAGSKYSSVKTLRDNNVKVKTENRAGKMHMKSIIIDDKYVVVGSMNFTKSGERYNDENVLIIENSKLAAAFKSKFLYFWKEIPDKWLYKNPRAESLNSINSCYDGIDNDFDGKIDKDDEGCKFRLSKP